MPWVEVGSTDIYYVEEGQGQPLVFLHGNSSCAEAWFQQFAHFRDRFRVIAYDSVNHGHSSNSPREEEEPDRADELQGFLTALGIQRPILAGNSMGGDTLLRWAALNHVDPMTLIASGKGVV
jgi:pimeloyl-ACP methyl ester carboxylesterase